MGHTCGTEDGVPVCFTGDAAGSSSSSSSSPPGGDSGFGAGDGHASKNGASSALVRRGGWDGSVSSIGLALISGYLVLL